MRRKQNDERGCGAGGKAAVLMAALPRGGPTELARFIGQTSGSAAAASWVADATDEAIEAAFDMRVRIFRAAAGIPASTTSDVALKLAMVLQEASADGKPGSDDITMAAYVLLASTLADLVLLGATGPSVGRQPSAAPARGRPSSRR